jgi:hypothetical protein
MSISVYQARVADDANTTGEHQYLRRYTGYGLSLLLLVCCAFTAWPVIAGESAEVVFMDQFETLACNDDIDADGDGFLGYPTDPGCTSIFDKDEVDDCPSGPGCAQCANAQDDDGDSFIDFPSDPGCSAASDLSELDLLSACADDIDADGDGFPGYPTDPGCTSIVDNDEVDDCPSGPTCAQCANAQDDDGDSFVDFPSDPDCSAASDASELNP